MFGQEEKPLVGEYNSNHGEENTGGRGRGGGGSPLLHRKRDVLRDAQPHHLALRVEGVEVDVGHDAEGRGGDV